MSLLTKRLFVVCYWLLLSSPTIAQLTITYPFPRMVVQRNQQNTAPVYIAGTFSIPVDHIEARLVPIITESYQTTQTTEWTTLDNAPQNGLYQGVVTAAAGSYRLEVRGLRGDQTVSRASVQRVGVGEVFLIAGQSNAMGISKLGAKGASERVVSFNAWNRFWNKNDVLESSDNPFPVPTFSQLSADNLIFPTGETAWCWGELGDHIADRYNVPVAFFNVAMPSTVAENWSCTANGIPAKNIFNSKYWPFLQPYSNLRNALQYYHNSFGIRAVLWHHGESDAVPLRTSKDDYYSYVKELIDRSRADFGRDITWVVSRCTITPAGPTPSPAIGQAQDSLAKVTNNQVWAGPDTDNIQSPRPAHGHFENIPNGLQGLSEFASAWNRNLNDAFFKQSRPQQPRQFIQTGLVPSEIPAGATVAVPVKLVGFRNTPTVSVQLLNAKGWFVTEVGRGRANGPLRVYMPDTLSTGLYQLRVVSTEPVIAGTPSLPFRVTLPGRRLNPFVDVQTEQVDSSTRVHWLTAQEAAGSQFFIERRDSPTEYSTIGSVPGRADGQLSHLYSFTDTAAPAGKNVYRVRVEQPNGEVQYSAELILGGPDEAVPQPAIYPNPTDGKTVTIRFPRNGLWKLTLADLTGRTIMQETITAVANNTVTLPLAAGLVNGMYVLTLQFGDQHHTQRLFVRH